MEIAREHRPFIIAIDGPAGSGKTTTARALARQLGFIYVDTGAMYRAVALFAQRRGVTAGDRDGVCALVSEIDIRLERVDGEQRTLLNGEDVEAHIRSQEMSRAASDFSAIPCVREAMVELQRRAGRDAMGAVLEGRDIGTVVFPDSPCKIFLVADADARALRRKLQLEQQGATADLATIRREIEERDRNDAEREHSPLRKAKDAIEVETTNTSIDEQVSMILTLVTKRIAAVEKGQKE
ncbi:MAG: (d)CMP kinase [Bacteroidota bacterium]|jgi:cytidylate kinase|nr:(d)CMP kinase [Bacteroidota bacterium]